MTYINLINTVLEIVKNSKIKLTVDLDKVESLKEFCKAVDYFAKQDNISAPRVYKAEDGTLDMVVEFERYYLEISDFEPTFAEICNTAKRLEFDSIESDRFKVKAVLGDIFRIAE